MDEVLCTAPKVCYHVKNLEPGQKQLHMQMRVFSLHLLWEHGSVLRAADVASLCIFSAQKQAAAVFLDFWHLGCRTSKIQSVALSVSLQKHFSFLDKELKMTDVLVTITQPLCAE